MRKVQCEWRGRNECDGTVECDGGDYGRESEVWKESGSVRRE